MTSMFALVKRHFKCFFKTKTNFFFALMVPLASIIIYLVFLRQLEFSTVEAELLKLLKNNVVPDELSILSHQLVDTWMFSGVLALSCITVSLNTCYVCLKDREQGVIKDFASSPISNSSLIISYLIFNFLVTFIVNLLVFVIEIIILMITGAFIINSVITFLLMIAAMVISILAASLMTFFIISFFSNNDSFNSVIAIFSAGAGFVIGTYMPLTMLGKLDSVASCLPGTYSVGIFRKVFLTGGYDKILVYFKENRGLFVESADITTALKPFLWNISFGGGKIVVEPQYYWAILAGFIGLFLIINLIFTNHNMQVRLLGKPQRIKKNKTKISNKS